MQQSSTISELAKALAAAQAEMPAVKMNATNPFLHNKYADLGSVIEATRPVLAKHGLAICQMPVQAVASIGLTTRLLHSSGEWLEDSISLPLEEEKGLKPGQVAGSIITYLRRYAWSAILGLYADEDTDGGLPATSERPQAKTETSKPAKPEGTTLQLLPDETMREDIWKRLLKNAEGNEAGAAVQLEIQTSFKGKDGSQVPGVRSVADLRGKRLQIAYERMRHRFPDEEPGPAVGDANEQA